MRPLHKRHAPQPAPQIAIAAPVFTAMKEAIEAQDYGCLHEIVAEALTLWHKKRQAELAALVQLSHEIENALATKKPDLKTLAELRAKGRILLGAREVTR